MLMLGRKVGRAIYVGENVTITVTHISRDPSRLATVTLEVKHDTRTVVSPEGVSVPEHIQRQMDADHREPLAKPVMQKSTHTLLAGGFVRIGRGITVLFLDKMPDGGARIGVEAPRHVVISRDDFSVDEHMQRQNERSTARKGG